MEHIEKKTAGVASEDVSISRRNLLLGSVGATVGGLLLADAARAQSHGTHGTHAVDRTVTLLVPPEHTLEERILAEQVLA